MTNKLETKTSLHHKLARWLDNRFTIPGMNIRFGLDPILGLLPGIGDWVGGLISLYFLFQAANRKARLSVMLRMLINILLDVIIGAVPVLGDIFDTGWKANLKNAELLDQLDRRPEETERQSTIIVWAFCLVAAGLVVGLLYLMGWLLVTLIGLLW